ncbi:MAG: NAD(P)H-hydrate dehydratase [Cyclobacteriaceae bacterium]
MIPILSAQQIRAADQHTIQHEPIPSVELMERASVAFVKELLKRVTIQGSVYIFCGVGNNGGDGLAIARLLKARKIVVYTYAIGSLEKASLDFTTNYRRIEDQVEWLESSSDLPKMGSQDLIIDALFGSGLSRPLEGLVREVIHQLNTISVRKVSVDIASGLYADQIPEKDSVIFQPDITISFQVPKWSFFQPSLSQYVGDFFLVDVGLDKDFIEGQDTNYFLLTDKDVRHLFKPRAKFSHKGDFGRLLIIAGSYGKMGAAVMCAEAAFRAGAGLVHVAAPACGMDILQSQVKEAMVIASGEHEVVVALPDLKEFDVIAVGPGLGQHKKTSLMVEKLLETLEDRQKLVIDADGINILSQIRGGFSKLPKHSILTPHPGEFARMVGSWDDDADKLQKLQCFVREYNVNIVLKGAYSAVTNSKGRVHFNTSGNPGMATAGSGDVLTGVIAGLLSSGLSPMDALKAGVFIHGLAGDLCADEFGERSLTAGDLIKMLPIAFKKT